MRDTASQQKLWDLEADLFAWKRVLTIVHSRPEDDLRSRYEKRLVLAEIHQDIHKVRKEIASIASSLPPKEVTPSIVDQPLFALVEVPKPRRRR